MATMDEHVSRATTCHGPWRRESCAWPQGPIKGASRRARYGIVLLIAGALALGLGQASLSQQRPPQLYLDGLVQGEPGQRIRVPLTLDPPSAIQPGMSIVVRGLPEGARLTPAQRISPTQWLVDPTALPNLVLEIGDDVTGQTEVTLDLVLSDGKSAQREAFLFTVRPPGSGPSRKRAATTPPVEPRPSGSLAPSAAAPVPQPAPRPPARPPAPEPRAALVTPAPETPAAPPAAARPRPSAETLEQIRRSLERAGQLVASGNIASARLFFERAANYGSSEGAMGVAATYDPFELSAIGAVGIQPDAALAREWYRKAEELGATAARARLQRLERN